jgi:hypothetical protein
VTPAEHVICRRCGKWFEPSDGGLVLPEGRFEANYRLGTGAIARFQCHRCIRIRRLTQRLIWGTFLGLVGLVFLLQWLGVLQ